MCTWDPSPVLLLQHSLNGLKCNQELSKSKSRNCQLEKLPRYFFIISFVCIFTWLPNQVVSYSQSLLAPVQTSPDEMVKASLLSPLLRYPSSLTHLEKEPVLVIWKVAFLPSALLHTRPNVKRLKRRKNSCKNVKCSPNCKNYLF